MPRRTDSGNPADWLSVARNARARPLCEALAEKYFADRYQGFDREDENWPELLRTAADIRAMLEIVEGRVGE